MILKEQEFIPKGFINLLWVDDGLRYWGNVGVLMGSPYGINGDQHGYSVRS